MKYTLQPKINDNSSNKTRINKDLLGLLLYDEPNKSHLQKSEDQNNYTKNMS